MSKIRVIARFVAGPKEEENLRALLQGMLASTHAEAGCEFYELYESHEKGRFYFYELWESQAHLDAHAQTPHFKNLVANVGPLLGEPFEVNLVEEILG